MTLWDCIVVGGGIAGSVVSNRLLEQDPTLKILLVEAGTNTHAVENIEWTDMNNAIGGEYDWGFSSVPQVHLNNREIASPVGKGLGGGTIINGAAWVRGHKVDYDIWAERVNDTRWSYDGQLPYMKKTETLFDNSTNPLSHGHTGPVKIQSPGSTNRVFPLREPLLESWREIGIDTLPQLDNNAGNNLGVADLQESRDKGKRQLSSLIYSLEGITVLTDSLVAKVLVEKSPLGHLVSRGIQLDNGTKIFGRETILSAGAYRTPQILILSGIGPADTLKKFDIPVILDQPAVGQNFHDHVLIPTVWQLKNASAGYTKESGDPVFSESQYNLGAFIDFMTITSLPKEGLFNAIAEDEGSVPDAATHPLLKQDRAHSSHLLQYSGVSADGSAVLMISVVFINSARGSVTIRSADIKDAPLINPNFLATSVDRYAARETIRRNIRLLTSSDTVLGREIVAGELAANPLTTESTDEEIDARVREMAGGCYHPAGTASMGTVVDTDLRVNGVSGLRIVDTSVFPVSISGNLQVAVYALAEQAAEIIKSTMKKC
ncbi:Putative glucose-methanol-choline oxidoreductase, FAD/NAD(P)-binding domain superfamily [Colletotrichum destructivum]|uniref:Glucose-methanol-choline oxidoreductase, FAD/NAD(P)-binding domain superfamily n=1 Tax=Colletotrichum destructivum TaxID=34406 RepID=A0AAX4IDQ9_9PEZI|nr:Putative glucose-methanol-choline oxidoreductase, FAD/NAD(P)-binding domain superfamily [Colletotrichum destructivum]